MSVVQNMNQFAQTTVKGGVSAIINPDTISVRVDPNSVATLVPGDVVTLTTVTSQEILVDKATASQLGFGVVIYTPKLDKWTKNDCLEVAMGGTVIWVEASGTVNRGGGVEYVPGTSTVIASAGTNPVVGIALDNVTTGNLFRILTRFTNVTSLQSQSVVTFNMPASQLTQLNTSLGSTIVVSTINPGTISALNVNAGQKLSFLFLTDGTFRNLTFGTNFRPTGSFQTGATAGKYIAVDFISDGLVYAQSGAATVV